jgi:hypothetical protein
MRGVFVAACARAEIRRARRFFRPVDRQYLAEETDLPLSVVDRIVWSFQREERHDRRA